MDEVMFPKELAQVQMYRFHNKDATENFESFHNSNFKKDEEKLKLKHQNCSNMESEL